ncbi:hypothetical protein ncot_11260 [Nocardioides sp. JQ2195]|uniref:hypothetical protein n=1 Tax=Nocardioides sp. JQ2195 TaxID=2592334 RepID=UPI00143ED3E6|nr:hypothetical protein [Nocardioides sp. JQ2195]QIX27108.1 hypothetical protein ncot_11260 [Nocardioides sp. JQ2195]
MNSEVLEGHLQHHWTGATGGVAFFDRVARTLPDREAAAQVRDIAREVNDDRESLRRIMVSLGFPPSRTGALVARAGEWVGRFKPNGRVISRSPLTDVLELEALRDAVSAKRIGWQLLRELAEHDGRIDPRHVQGLLDRADSQLDRLQQLHLQVAMDRILE